MVIVDKLVEYPYLKYSFFSYLLLGITDTIHHLHVALILGHETAMHAVVIGIILLPISIILIWLFTRFRKNILVQVFIPIPILTIIVPGFYHGGWDHFVKILSHLRVESDSTNIRLLFPPENLHLWFYEISGVLEFFLAMICAYCLYRYISNRSMTNYRLSHPAKNR